ncbi:MAG: MFS transporter [Planctomycetota bacterium]
MSEPAKPDPSARASNGLLTGHGASVLWFCWFGWAFDFQDLILFAFLKQSVASELGLSTAALAQIDGATFGAAALGGFVAGRVADRDVLGRGRSRVLVVSILLFALAALTCALAQSFGALLFGRILAGLAVGGEWGIGHAAVAESSPPELRQRRAAFLQAATPVGLALAAINGCFLAPVIGWRGSFAITALGAVVAAFGRLAFRNATREAPPRPAAVPARAWELLAPAYRQRTLRLLFLLVLHMTGFWCCYAWLPSLLLREAGASMAFVGGFHLALALVHVVADLAFGSLADRFGRTRSFVALSVLTATGCLAIALGLDWLRTEPWLLLFALAAVGLGAGTWSAFGTWFTDGYPDALRATASCTLYNLARASQLAAQPLLAALVSGFGTLAVGVWIAVACALGAAFFAPHESRRPVSAPAT